MIRSNLQNIQPSYIREILAAATQPDMISFAGGLPDPKSFPILLMSESYKKLEQHPELFQYNNTRGLDALIEAISARLSLASNRSLIITNGSQQGLDLVARAFIAPGDQVLVEAPSYLGALQVFKLAGANVQSIAIQDNGLNLVELRKCFASNKIKFFYIIPDYQNPTGYCYPLALRKGVAQLCREFNVVIIEDSPYRELGFNGQKLTPISEFYPEGTIVLHSFSKIVSPGLRIGCVEATSAIIDTLVKLKQIADLHSNIPSQFVLSELLKHDEFDQHIQGICKNYQEKYQLLTFELERTISSEISFQPVSGGMFIWLTFNKAEISATDFANRALKNKLAVVPGSVFYEKESSTKESIRLNFSHPSLADIEQGVERFALTLKEF